MAHADARRGKRHPSGQGDNGHHTTSDAASPADLGGTTTPTTTGAPLNAADNDTATSNSLESLTAGSQSLNAMSLEAMRSLLKARTGFETHLLPLLKLYLAQPGELGTSINVNSVIAQYKDYEASAAKESDAESALRSIVEDRMVANDGVWSVMLEIYGKARNARAIRGDEAVRNFRAFMRKRRISTTAPAPAEAAPTESTTPATPESAPAKAV